MCELLRAGTSVVQVSHKEPFYRSLDIKGLGDRHSAVEEGKLNTRYGG